MPKLFVFMAALVLFAFTGHSFAADGPFAHMVFFTLADDNEGNRQELVDGCKQFLSDHQGVMHFSVGTRAKKYDREVNDQQFDVALHLIFETDDDHDVYHTHPRHLKFIEEYKHLWSGVRVFDSYLKNRK